MYSICIVFTNKTPSHISDKTSSTEALRDEEGIEEEEEENDLVDTITGLYHVSN